METLPIVMVVGAIGGLIAWIWLVVVAFQESTGWGVGCLVLPEIVGLVFLIFHPKAAIRPFLLFLASMIPTVAAMTAELRAPGSVF